VLLVVVVSMKDQRFCDVGGAKVNIQRGVDSNLPRSRSYLRLFLCHHSAHMSQLQFESQGGRCEESREMLCYRAAPVMPLSIWPFVYSELKPSPFGGAGVKHSGARTQGRDPRDSSREREWPRRVKSVPSTDAREKSEVKIVPVSVSACIS